MDHSEVKYLPTDAAQSIAKNKPVRHSRREGVFTPLDYMRAFPGDHAAYTLLSQLVYWRLPKDNGQSRLTIQDDQGNWVIAKTAAEFEQETGLTRRQVDKAKARLVKMGIISTQSGARDATKTTFYSFKQFPGNTPLTDYPTMDELRGIAPVGATHCTCGCDPLHAQVHSNTETVSKTVSKTKNIKNAGAGNTPASTIPETASEQSGKNATSNKPEASQPVLDLCLSQKREFLKLNQNADKHPGNLVPELTAADRDIAQRLEFRLTEAGIDAVAFLTWLTPVRFQKLTLEHDVHTGYALLWMGEKGNQTYLMGAYRAYLAECAKFSSNQQLALTAIAPKELKIPLPLYEENPGLVAAMFDHADYWRAQQTDGLLGGKTLPQYLAGWQWTTPEMMGWLDNEAVRERVEELLSVPKAVAA